MKAKSRVFGMTVVCALLSKAGEPVCSSEAGKAACQALHVEGFFLQCH